MSPELEQRDMGARQAGLPQARLASAAVQGLAVECVVFDQADRPKRRHVMSLSGLLKPLSGGVTGLAADAR